MSNNTEIKITLNNNEDACNHEASLEHLNAALKSSVNLIVLSVDLFGDKWTAQGEYMDDEEDAFITFAPDEDEYIVTIINDRGVVMEEFRQAQKEITSWLEGSV